MKKIVQIHLKELLQNLIAKKEKTITSGDIEWNFSVFAIYICNR